MTQVLGIDCAHWQRKLRWPKIVNVHPVNATGSTQSDLSVRFAYVKATHGTGGPDEQFSANAEGSIIMPFRGFYAWFVPTQDPIVQADKFVDAILPFQQKNDLPPGMDLEDNAGGRLSGRQILDPFRACCERIEDRLSRRVLVYTGKWFWQAIGNMDDEWIARRPLWHSEYPGRIPGEGECAHLPFPWASRAIDEAFWQFDGDKGLYLPAECGDTGKPVDCDFNRFLGEEDALVRFIRGTQILPPIPTLQAFTPVEVPSRDDVLERLFPSKGGKGNE